MSRIIITCSEKDKKSILRTFECSCPFNPYPEECGDDITCSECIEQNIEFKISSNS